MKRGSIQLAAGPMFSGKTNWLIEKIDSLDPETTLTISYSLDTRFGKEMISSHDGKSHKAIPVEKTSSIKSLVDSKNPLYLAIDEVQFFDTDIVKYLDELRDKRIDIFVAGLDFDYLKNQWINTQKIVKIADVFYSLKAICSICNKKNAIYSKRIKDLEKRVVIGGSELYEPRCENHFDN